MLSTLVGLTAFMALLVAVLAFALVRFMAAARDARRHARRPALGDAGGLSVALQAAVTELKAQERASSARAAASEQLSTQIVDSITAGLLLVDRTGCVEIVNPAAGRMLGLPSGTTALPHFRDLLAEAPLLADAIGECLTTARPIMRRALRMPESVPASHLGVTVSPIGPAGESRGAICLFSDLTAVVELEEQLRLKEALARVGELTAGIAHEFRNGLATIHGYSRLIDPQALPPRYQPYVEGIREETDLLGQMVTNFLGFARPEQIVFQPVALDRLVRRVADDLHHELPGLSQVDVEGAWGRVEGDEVLLRQVFGNLIRNAAEACQEAGTTPCIRIRGEVDARQGVCRVSVDDNGPGIPESARGRVFEPFFTTRSRGTGLGLAIVQKVVVMHNGRVTVRGAPGGGASVQMTFPICAS